MLREVTEVLMLKFWINPKIKLKDTESEIKNRLINLLSELRGSKFVTTLVLELENDNETKCSTSYSNSKAEKVINESDIDDIFESIYTTIISDIQKFLEKGLDWIIDSIILLIFWSTIFSLVVIMLNYQKIRTSTKKFD